ncbi:Hypp2594 [Branchiostoma lanceolatum]|uniref:Hypp2594 protein n=1 Tax=Branchiostoma lanceolatum TaxID=7740 RepID=A0A8J9ZSR7_BRALA|nr:Hypp2594 [Branchiostoma lanceolatum]
MPKKKNKTPSATSAGGRWRDEVTRVLIAPSGGVRRRHSSQVQKGTILASRTAEDRFCGGAWCKRLSDHGRVGSERREMSGATRSGHALSHVCVGFNCLVNRLGAPGHQLLTVVWLKPMLDTGMCNISYKIMSATLHGEGETVRRGR